MIHELALAARTGMFTGRLAQTVHAYPAWSTAIRSAADSSFSESTVVRPTTPDPTSSNLPETTKEAQHVARWGAACPGRVVVGGAHGFLRADVLDQ